MAKNIEFETDTFRVSFPYLATPSEFDGKLAYKVDALFDPTTANAFWTNLVTQAQAMLAVEFPGREHLFQWPQMKDGNTNIAKSDPQQQVKNGYAGNYYCTLKSAEPVGVVRFDPAQNMDINIDPKQVYSGCYARAFIQVWLQDNTFGQRVNIKLLAVKFIADGDSLGGAVPINAATVFQPGQGAMPAGAQVANAQPMQTVHTPQQPVAPGVPGMAPQQPVAPGVPGMAPQQPVAPGVPGMAPQQPVAPGVPGQPVQSPFLQ